VTASTHSARLATVVLDIRGLLYATEKSVVDTVLCRLQGVHLAKANPVSQTATVTFDPGVTSVRELARCIEECGYHCPGQSVPAYLYDPMVVPAPTPTNITIRTTITADQSAPGSVSILDDVTGTTYASEACMFSAHPVQAGVDKLEVAAGRFWGLARP